MSHNLCISFFNKKHRVFDLPIYQTPTELTKNILGKNLKDKTFTKNNFENDFIKPYVLFLNKKNLSIKEFNNLWYKCKFFYASSFSDVSTNKKSKKIDIELFNLYNKEKPTKPFIMFDEIIEPDFYNHILILKNYFNTYIDNYPCIGYSN